MVLTIIRYRDGTYFGLEGEIEYPTTMHSGFIHEERKIKKIIYDNNANKKIDEGDEIINYSPEL